MMHQVTFSSRDQCFIGLFYCH